MFGFGKKKKASQPQTQPQAKTPSGQELQNPYRRFYGKNRSFEELVPKPKQEKTKLE